MKQHEGRGVLREHVHVHHHVGHQHSQDAVPKFSIPTNGSSRACGLRQTSAKARRGLCAPPPGARRARADRREQRRCGERDPIASAIRRRRRGSPARRSGSMPRAPAASGRADDSYAEDPRAVVMVRQARHRARRAEPRTSWSRRGRRDRVPIRWRAGGGARRRAQAEESRPSGRRGSIQGGGGRGRGAYGREVAGRGIEDHIRARDEQAISAAARQHVRAYFIRYTSTSMYVNCSTKRRARPGASRAGPARARSSSPWRSAPAPVRSALRAGEATRGSAFRLVSRLDPERPQHVLPQEARARRLRQLRDDALDLRHIFGRVVGVGEVRGPEEAVVADDGITAASEVSSDRPRSALAPEVALGGSAADRARACPAATHRRRPCGRASSRPARRPTRARHARSGNAVKTPYWKP